MLFQERDKAKAELENTKKRQHIVETKAEKLQEGLKESKKENEEMKEKLRFLESHRESLLDKVSLILYYSLERV